MATVVTTTAEFQLIAWLERIAQRGGPPAVCRHTVCPRDTTGPDRTGHDRTRRGDAAPCSEYLSRRKEELQWEGFSEKEGFKAWNERVSG